MLNMSETSHNYKKRRSNQIILTIILVAVVTLAVALYKINRTQERIEIRNIKAKQNTEQFREKSMDKYMGDYAEGAAWALKNSIIDPEECDDAGVSSLNNLGCVAVATELKQQLERDAARVIGREDIDQEIPVEELAPEEAFLNEAYLEPEMN